MTSWKNLNKNMFAFATTLSIATVAALAAQGCGKSSGTINITALTPIVKSALPSGFQPGSSAVMVERHAVNRLYTPSTNETLGAQYLAAVFQNYFVNGNNSGGSPYTQGYILNQVTIADGRTALFNGQSSSSWGCLGNTVNPFRLDLSSLNSGDTTTPTNMLKFTLQQVQCLSPFSSPSSAASGEVFGVNGSNTSIWVTLSDMSGDSLAAGGAFINLFNLTNAGSSSTSAPESVDGLSINYGPAASNTPAGTISVARFKATPTTNTFEMFFVSNGSSVGGFNSSGTSNGSPNYLGAGYRMISDGNYIYADGRLCTDSSGPNCGTASYWQPFYVCMNAGTLAVVDPTATADCVTLANAFTLSTVGNGTISNTSFTGSFTSPDPLTFTALTGDSNLGDIGSISFTASNESKMSAIVTALSGVYSVSNASSVTSQPSSGN